MLCYNSLYIATWLALFHNSTGICVNYTVSFFVSNITARIPNIMHLESIHSKLHLMYMLRAID